MQIPPDAEYGNTKNNKTENQTNNSTKSIRFNISIISLTIIACVTVFLIWQISSYSKEKEIQRTEILKTGLYYEKIENNQKIYVPLKNKEPDYQSPERD